GYTRERIAARHRGNVGVFAGITKTGFDLHGYELLKRGDTIHPHTSFSSVANRVSYVFNLHGPSVPVDTMCSSSLTAIHEACAHIQRGDCEMAIAGGVNLYLHPTGYVGLSAKHMLSDDGRCKSFGAHANGFVPGEGVGAVLLKPLSRALADGDRIHAVIRATSINHGGKTNGYTVPNPNAQAQLIRAALVRAGVNARTVSYVEAHGTGTELGDPIEVAGLTQAFRHDTADAQFCALGSVKSNIGHLEAAAGIAGLTKIVLQMKHQALSPSLHADELNPNIAFARTPFFVQRERGEWKRPVVAIDGAPAVEFPRIACLSSFGAGGANAHVVLEEYVADEVDQGPGASAMPALIVLSARTGAQLREQARRLLEAAQGGHHERFDDADLHAVAQTLQTGREAMQERLALACTTVRELCDKLAAYCDGARQVDGLFTGQVRHDGPLAKLAGDDDAGALVDAWLRKGRFNDLLELWVAGFHIDWERLHGGRRGKPVSLPTYPFLKERHWFDKVAAPAPDLAAMPARVLHPLVHENTSDLSEQRYSSTFTGAEFFLRDHVIQGTPVLPGVAALEMALHAVGRASGAGATALSLCNVAWVQPIQVSTPRTVHIGVYPAEGGQVDVEIYSESEDGVIVHSQGAAMPCAAPQNVRLDVDALRGACAEALMPAAECYAAYRAMGIDYGPSHQAIEQVHVGPKQVLARLALPAGLAATAAQFVLHPALLDGALQALIGMVRNAGASGLTTALVPFALDRLDVLDPVLDPAFAPQWVWARYSADDQPDGAVRKFDIDLCDGAGQVGVRLAGFSTRALVQAPPPVADAGKDLLLLTPGWRAADSADASAPHRHVVVLCDLEPGVGAQVTALMDGAECVALERPAGGIAARFGAHALGVFDQVRGLLASRSAGPVLLQVLAPAVGEQAMLAGLAGLLKTARAEDPNLLAQLVEVERCDDAQALVAALRHGRQDPHAARVRSTAGGFASGCWEELTLPADAPPTPWKDGGVYLITGGAGAIGLLLADEIARRARNPVLVLVGRSAPGTALQGRIAALRATGAKVEYRQADVADPQAVEALLGELARLHGPLNGILHCAGVTRDAFIAAKPREHWRAVLAPKVDGIVNLDHGSRAMPLDLFVAFSSAAGALGNPGQADYAAANAFMDAYCGYRASLARAGQRHGASLSINWPLWADGGMALDAAMVEHKLRPAGLALLRTDSALHALYHALAMGNSQVMVLEGDGGAIRSMLRQHAR
ncbi:MAG: SDR family NAD(P)-dependent oxidoreductase, partial [Gammaproteobacteria bacterium]